MFTDTYPETTTNPVLTEADLKDYKGERCSNPFDPARFTPLHHTGAPLPAPASSALPSVTEMELAALRGVDVAEAAADPINKFNAARAGIKLAAWVARKLR
jgi:hypothetical protein